MMGNLFRLGSVSTWRVLGIVENTYTGVFGVGQHLYQFNSRIGYMYWIPCQHRSVESCDHIQWNSNGILVEYPNEFWFHFSEMRTSIYRVLMTISNIRYFFLGLRFRSVNNKKRASLIQYIFSNILQFIAMDLYALDINAQAILPGTRICTYQGSITLRTVYCTTYGNTRYLKYNILQYLFTTIQYIAICVIDNTIYCNIRQIQNNILYCQDTPI